MAKRKFKVDARYYFDVIIEIDEDNPEFKDIVKSYTSTIDSSGDVESLMEHIVHNHIYLGIDFVQGVGNISEAEKKGAIKIISSDEDNEYDIEELK